MDIPRCFIKHTDVCEHFLTERNAEIALRKCYLKGEFGSLDIT